MPTVYHVALPLRQLGGGEQETDPDDDVPPLAEWTEGIGWQLAAGEFNDDTHEALRRPGAEVTPENNPPPQLALQNLEPQRPMWPNNLTWDEWEEDPYRADTTNEEEEPIPYPAFNLDGVVIVGLSRETDERTEEEARADPPESCYLDVIPGWTANEKERLYWLIDFVSTGGPELYPGVWGAEQLRLEVRRDYLRRTIPNVQSGYRHQDQLRDELAQVEALLSLEEDLRRRARRDEELEELHNRQRDRHRGSRARRRAERQTENARNLTQIEWHQERTRQLEDELDATVRRAHTLSTYLAHRTVHQWRMEYVREQVELGRRGLLRRLAATIAPQGTEQQLEREAMERAWREQYERLGRLLVVTPPTFEPTAPELSRPANFRAPPLPGSMEGYPRGRPRGVDNLGRPFLPPGWAWRGDTDTFYYRELWDFVAVHPRTPDEERLIDRSFEQVSNFRDLHYPRMADILRIQEQRRREPPRASLDEDETHPMAEADPDDFDNWRLPTEDIDWSELPQAFMVDHRAAAEQSGVGWQVAVYREAGLWAGDNGEIQALREDLWITVLLLFGGIGAELEALLKGGLCIKPGCSTSTTTPAAGPPSSTG